MLDSVLIYSVPSSVRQPVATERDASEKKDARLYMDAAIGDLFFQSIAANATETVRTVLRKLCLEHPSICIDTKMLGGQPHIKGLRLSVGDVLAKLYTHGNTERVRELYPDLSLSQVKEAIAFAQDFLEEMSVQR